ncbi:MAG: hypothetical protein PVF47_07690 [Anaerolineae bacterium]
MHDYKLADFWAMAPARRQNTLVRAIARTHAYHYRHNRAYRQTVAARGIGATVDLDGAATPSQAGPLPAEVAEILPRLVRPTAQTFKSYIDLLGTPFPQDRPPAFLAWLDDQLSIDLPGGRLEAFRSRYRSLEALLRDVERKLADLGLEVLTSSGTSGRSTIMVRDRAGTAKTVESFYLSFQRYLGVEGVQRVIFVMPRQTRIAMARMANFSVRRLGLADDHVHFAIPFPAEPDRVRIRAGRTFRPGWEGVVERRFWFPFINWMQERYVTPRAVKTTIELLGRAEAAGEKVLAFGGWVQLHAIARALQDAGRRLRLAPGSLLGSGGGLKELYPFTPAQIRRDLAAVIELADGSPIPIRDVYGMAEGNWAAMQCREGNYHVPPWIYARTLDDDDRLQQAADATGLLAFFDPYGGGDLFPAFFKTSDRVRLILGDGAGNGARRCPCGEAGAYLARDSIQRVDLLDEAGCAAQL